MSSAKRQKQTHHHQQEEEEEEEEDDYDFQSLLPGLPNHIAKLCLSNIHPLILYTVCRSWRRLIYSPSFPPFLSLYSLLISPDDSARFFSLDPISSKWEPLPSPPHDPPLLLRHPSFLSRKLPIQSVSVSGKLVLLAATSHDLDPALAHPLVFNPVTREWISGPPLIAPRRWCAVGSSSDVVYVASGVGSQFSTDVARSFEKWDLNKRKLSRWNNCNSAGWSWEKMKGLKDSRFSRDAIDAVGYRGKLCLVNIKGEEGMVYDVEEDTWHYMAEGMVRGWRGPTAAMDEEVLYTVDEAIGALRKYDEQNDDWAEILKSEMLVGAQQISAGGGKVCVVCEDGGILVVDVKAAPPRMWAVDTPPQFEALTVHIVPRMTRTFSDFGY